MIFATNMSEEQIKKAIQTPMLITVTKNDIDSRYEEYKKNANKIQKALNCPHFVAQFLSSKYDELVHEK